MRGECYSIFSKVCVGIFMSGSFFGNVAEKSKDLSFYFKEWCPDLKSALLRIALPIIAAGALQRLKQPFPQMANRFSELQITLLSISLLKPLCSRVFAIYFNCDKDKEEIDNAVGNNNVQKLNRILFTKPPSLKKYAMTEILQAGKPELLEAFAQEIGERFSASEQIDLVSSCSLKICGTFGGCSIFKAFAETDKERFWDIVVQQMAKGTCTLHDFHELSPSAERAFVAAVGRDVETLFPLIYQQAMAAKRPYVLYSLTEVLYKKGFYQLSLSIQQKVVERKLERGECSLINIRLEDLFIGGDENSYKFFQKALNSRNCGSLLAFKTHLEKIRKHLSIPGEFWRESSRETLEYACMHFSPIPEHIRKYALKCLLDNTWNPSQQLINVLEIHEYFHENIHEFTLDQQSVYWTLYNPNIEKLREVISEKNLTTILENHKAINLDFISEVFRLVQEKYPSNFNEYVDKYIYSKFLSNTGSLHDFEEVFNEIASNFPGFLLSTGNSIKVIQCLISSQSFKPVSPLLEKNLKVVFSEPTSSRHFKKIQFYFWTFFSPNEQKISDLLAGEDTYYGAFPPILNDLADEGLMDRIDWYKSYTDTHFLQLAPHLRNDQCIEKILYPHLADLSLAEKIRIFTRSQNFNLLCRLVTPNAEGNPLTAANLDREGLGPCEKIIFDTLKDDCVNLQIALRVDEWTVPELEQLLEISKMVNPKGSAIEILALRLTELKSQDPLVKFAGKTS